MRVNVESWARRGFDEARNRAHSGYEERTFRADETQDMRDASQSIDDSIERGSNEDEKMRTDAVHLSGELPIYDRILGMEWLPVPFRKTGYRKKTPSPHSLHSS